MRSEICSKPSVHMTSIQTLCSASVSEHKTRPETCPKFQNRPVLGIFPKSILGTTVCSWNFLEKICSEERCSQKSCSSNVPRSFLTAEKPKHMAEFYDRYTYILSMNCVEEAHVGDE